MEPPSTIAGVRSSGAIRARASFASARWFLVGGVLFPLLASCGSSAPGGPAWPADETREPVETKERVFSSRDTTPAVIVPRSLPDYWWNQPSETRPTLRGGHYLAVRDSLGFTDFRELPEAEQRDRRLLAKKYIKQGDQRTRTLKSLDDYATAVGLCPYYPKGWLFYAEAAIKLGNYATGRYLLQGVERTLKFAGNVKNQEKIASQFYFLDAVASYNLGETERSLESVENSLELRDNQMDARLLRARCLTDLGRYDEAREKLEEFDFGTSYWARAQAIRGVLEMKVGNLGRAARAFSEAKEYGVRSGVMENDWGRLRLLQDRPKDAASHFRRAIRFQPELMEARSNLAVALRRQGKDEEAEEVLRSALAINPDFAPAHFNLAELYRSRMDGLEGEALRRTADLAREHYDLTVEHHYRIKDSLEHRAWVALRIGDLEAAEADLLRLAGSDDVDGRVLFLLARTKKEQGELRIAEQLLRMAIDRGYAGADVHSDLGEVLLRREDLEGARRELETALRLDQDLIATRINLCQVLLEMGEREEAERELREAERRAPHDPAVQAQRRALRSP